jgi:predicted thioesterase
MKPGLKRGSRVEHYAKVRSWMRPHLDGLVRHPLYSTWAMAYHCEVAARKLLAPYLDPDEEAVGAGLVLEHLAPAPVGGEVRLVCILSRMKKNRLYTHLDVYWKNRKIGRGSHLQVVMPRRRFEALVHGTKEWPHGQSPN